MSISTDLDAWWTTKKNYDESNEAKAKFQETMQQIDQSLDRLQAMYAAGDYDQLPASVRTEFVWAWTQLDNARDAVRARAAFMEAMNWRPS